jgi:hypothetical protein
MICPQCRSERCNRSRRQGVRDHTLGVLGLRPWRCEHCNRRFYAWLAALPFQFHVHCGRCGNFDLQRISSKWVDVWYARIARLLRVPAYRCDPCRHKFFSVRSFRRIRSIESEEEAATVESRVASS